MEVVALHPKLAIIFLFAACLSLHSIQATVIKYCNKKTNYIVKVNDVEILPYPVETGEPTTFTIKASTGSVCDLFSRKCSPIASAVLVVARAIQGNSFWQQGFPFRKCAQNPNTFLYSLLVPNDQALTGGKMALDVSYFGVKVHSETHNICEKTSCPISVGKFVLSHTQTLPGITPPGSYTLKMKMEDEKKHQLTCISFNFNIGLSVSSI